MIATTYRVHATRPRGRRRYIDSTRYADRQAAEQRLEQLKGWGYCVWIEEQHPPKLRKKRKRLPPQKRRELAKRAADLRRDYAAALKEQGRLGHAEAARLAREIAPGLAIEAAIEVPLTTMKPRCGISAGRVASIAGLPMFFVDHRVESKTFELALVLLRQSVRNLNKRKKEATS